VVAPPEDLARAAVAGTPGALDAYLAALRDRVFGGPGHFGAHVGIEILEVLPERVTMRLPWRAELQRQGDIFHGGAIMALADHVGGCLFHTDPRPAASSATGLTTDFSMSFLRAAKRGEALLARGTVLRRGRNVTFLQVDVLGEGSGLAIATCRTTYLTVVAAKVGA